MSQPELTETLRQEYADLFARAALRPAYRATAAAVADRLARPEHWRRYRLVAAATAVPAHVVAILHTLEAGGNFACHLHNGDPLTARTVRVPAGRPVVGEPPFPWETSAVDALTLRRLTRWTDWSIPGLAYVLEGYNGGGYRRFHPDVHSPYLWGGTTVYRAGKYVADGAWSSEAVSRQLGGMAILARLIAVGLVLPDGGATTDDPPAWGGHTLGVGDAGAAVLAVQRRLWERGVQAGGRPDGRFGPQTARAVRAFQAEAGTALRVDGLVGPRTWQALFDAATATGLASLPGLSGTGTAPAAARPWYRAGFLRRLPWSERAI